MNTPNKITLVRLLLIPVIVFFYLADFIPYGRLVATIIFIIACLTDFVDGYLARKNNQVTDLGKFFDSIADKVLIMTGIILIVAAPVVGAEPIIYPSWLGIVCGIIMLAREFIISALRQIAAAKGIVLAADKGGKIKATIQYVSVTLYMAFAFVMTDIVTPAQIENKAIAIVRFILMIIFVIATFMTIYSGVSYLVRNRKLFVTEKNDNFVNNDESSQEAVASEESLTDELKENNEENQNSQEVQTEKTSNKTSKKSKENLKE